MTQQASCTWSANVPNIKIIPEDMEIMVRTSNTPSLGQRKTKKLRGNNYKGKKETVIFSRLDHLFVISRGIKNGSTLRRRKFFPDKN